jgi:hypothetical protein
MKSVGISILLFMLAACSSSDVHLGDVSGREFDDTAEVIELLGCDSVVWADNTFAATQSADEAFPLIKSQVKRDDGVTITAMVDAGDQVWLLLDENNRVWGAASPGSVQYCFPPDS